MIRKGFEPFYLKKIVEPIPGQIWNSETIPV